LEPIFQVTSEDQTDEYGRFIIEPLAPGFGHTLGNSFRRVLLTALPGLAIVSAKVEGVRHQFTTLSGLKEDIVELILNLKQVRIAGDIDKPAKITLEAIGPKEVKAGLLKLPAGLKSANPDLVIANLADKKAKLKIEMEVEKGYGYSPYEQRKTGGEIGVIPVDALFSPVRRVNYQVAATRVGGMVNFEKLALEIWTDGTIKPLVALKEAAKIVIAYFSQVIEPKKRPAEKKLESLGAAEEAHKLSIEELAIPVRISNTLMKGQIETVGDLVKAGRKKLNRIKNLGEKSLKIIEAALLEKGVNLVD